MGKALGSWSGMKKYLEQEMLADSLRGRVAYSCTKYPGMDGSGLFEVRVDGKMMKRFSMETIAIDELAGTKAIDMQHFWSGYWQQKEQLPLESRNEFDDAEFSEALSKYRCLPIEQALESVNPIIRMFAVLDRRVGKRTLQKIKDTVERQPEWLQYFYSLRVTAEKI